MMKTGGGEGKVREEGREGREGEKRGKKIVF